MKAQIVSFHCVLKDRIGKIISSTFNHDVITYIQGQNDQLQGLVEGLQNLKKGEKRKISVAAQKAYGFYDPELVVEFARRSLEHGSELTAGQEVTTELNGERRTFRVIKASRDSVTLDANHPLAGQDLVFEIETTAARFATAQEIQESILGDLPPHLH
jgi:FKBP-type peptidyl-prolyl cis-trans isomerase SlyD